MRRGALAAVLVLTGCGGGSAPSSGSTTNPGSTSTPAPAATRTSPPALTPTATTATTPRRRKARGEAGPGGAGDEQAPRVPASYRLAGGKLTPPTISVPAFFRVQLLVANADGRAHVLALAGPGLRRTLSLPARARTTRILAGLRRGRFRLQVDGRRAGALVSGVEPGP